MGEYTATVVYKGNSKYNPSTTTAKVTVTKLTSCISGVYNAETQEVVGTLTNSAGVPLSANVVVSLNGVNYAMKSDFKGQFKVSTADLTSWKLHCQTHIQRKQQIQPFQHNSQRSNTLTKKK